jgi:hypothetical protein
MAKATKSVRRVRTTRKSKALRLPLTPAIKEFVAGYASHQRGRGSAWVLPEKATRRQREAAQAADEAAAAARDAFVRAAIEQHVGEVAPYGEGILGFEVKMRKLRTLDDIAIAAVIGMVSQPARDALAKTLAGATGLNIERDLWGWSAEQRARLRKAA